MLVLVTGPISSGTRLVSRLLDASPDVDAVHDDTHGFLRDWQEPYDALVVVSRDRFYADSSRFRRNPNTMSTKDQMVFIDKLRGRVPTIDITYEDVCGDSSAVIETLASFLGVQVWEFEEEVVEQNTKWDGGPEPTPELHPERFHRTILRPESWGTT